jgi:acyl-CoA dehydrogenase
VRKGAAAPFMAALQQNARDAGLWNLGLPELSPEEPGTRLSNLEYAPLAEIMGRLFWAPEVFNCQAPDVPNMIALQNCATPEQKERWLRPLLNAETRSAFGRTEPDVASSDATNIATKMVRDGDDYIITGRKWFITGAAHPRCSFLIVLGVTDPQAERTRRHSCMIVPMNTPGVRLVRRLSWMGCEDHIAPIGELAFDNVRVPKENLLGEEGEGFKVAQIRLGPARIHHCMRSIGLCELLIELMMVRATERSAFGRPLVLYDTVQRWIAESRVELEQARLLCYRCAWLLDRAGHHGAWRDVSLIKVAVPAMLQRIADRALQVFGVMGGSEDTPIHQALAWGRLLRIGDGPDEVHLRQIFRMEAMPSWSIGNSPYLAAHPA